MTAFTINGHRFELDRESVEDAVGAELPDPIKDHFVVVGGRRFPPKQVVSAATGLDRAEFTTHHARRILQRLGFAAGRRSRDGAAPAPRPDGRSPFGGRQAEMLRPFAGKWVALAGPFEVLVAADAPEDVLAWLASHGVRATGMFRVPAGEREAEGLAPL